MDIPAHAQAWAAMQQARDKGDLDEAEKQQKLWRQLLTAPNSRADAEKDKAEDQEPPIDWDLVNREAAIGVELNRKAMAQWRKIQGDQRSSNKSAEQFNS
jgi:hypothetical protein